VVAAVRTNEFLFASAVQCLLALWKCVATSSRKNGKSFTKETARKGTLLEQGKNGPHSNRTGANQRPANQGRELEAFNKKKHKVITVMRTYQLTLDLHKEDKEERLQFGQPD